MLLKAFCKYQFGVFDEDGFLYDNLYPAAYVDGNSTVSNHGCKDSEMKNFCPLGSVYDRYAPTKQNLLCTGASVLETILNHEELKVYTFYSYPNLDSPFLNFYNIKLVN